MRLLFWYRFLMLILLSSPIMAATHGVFTYEPLYNETILITKCQSSVTGSIEIPDKIASMPVTSIGERAFYNCRDLIGITIPTSVSSIGSRAFHGCSSLTSIEIPDGVTSIAYGLFSGCNSLSSITIPSSVSSIEGGAFSQCSSLTSFTIPDGVTSIEASLFSSCSSLISIIIPSSVRGIKHFAFSGCTNLKSLFFLGDAPPYTGKWPYLSGLFAYNTNHTVYYLDTSTGFTPSTLYGQLTQEINTSVYPAAKWLLGSGLDYDMNLNQDLNGDGVSLLMAYALKLNPNEHLAAQLPKAQLSADSTSMTYYSGSAGVSYEVQSSKDLKSWDSTGVTVSDPDGDDMVTASFDRNEDCQFLRLVIKED